LGQTSHAKTDCRCTWGMWNRWQCCWVAALVLVEPSLVLMLIAIALVPQSEGAINLPLPLIQTEPWPSVPECILQILGRDSLANPGESPLFLHFMGAFHEGGKREPR